MAASIGARLQRKAARTAVSAASPHSFRRCYGEKFIVELSNATLSNVQGFQAEKADLTLTINRSDLEQTMGGVKTLEAQMAQYRLLYQPRELRSEGIRSQKRCTSAIR